MGLRGGVATLAGGLARFAAPFIDHGVGHAGGNEAHRHSFLGTSVQGFLDEEPRFGS